MNLLGSFFTNKIVIIGLLVLSIGGFIYYKFDQLQDEIVTLNATIGTKESKITDLTKDVTIKELTINTHVATIKTLAEDIIKQNEAIELAKVDSIELNKKITELKSVKPSIQYIKKSNDDCSIIKNNLKVIKGLKYEDL